MNKVSVLVVGLTLVVGTGDAFAQNRMNSGRPSAVLTAERCGELWKRAVPEGDSLAQANAGPFIVNFAQVDADGNGNISLTEFEAACNKGMVKDTGQ